MIIGFQELFLKHKEDLPIKKNYAVYRDIWETLNRAIVDVSITAETVKLPQQFGELSIRRYRRKVRLNKNGQPMLPVNWAKTKKLKLEGKLDKDKFIYHTDPFYLGFHISFKQHAIIGKRAYKFKASRTNGYNSTSGATNKLWKHLTENNANYLKFPLM